MMHDIQMDSSSSVIGTLIGVVIGLAHEGGFRPGLSLLPPLPPVQFDYRF